MFVKITSLLGQQQLVEGFPSPHLHSTLSIIHVVDKLVALEQIITVPAIAINFRGSYERQVTSMEKRH